MYKANKKIKNLTNRNKKTAKKSVPSLKEWNAIFAKVFQSGEKPENECI